MIEGYNIAIKLNGKTVLGRTQENLNISARTKTSITKDDQGVEQEKVTGHDVTLKVTAFASIPASGETATKLGRDDVLALALAKGNAAVLPLQYLCDGCSTYGGNAIITGYSEDSSAEVDSDTTLNLDLKITGDFAIVTQNNG